MSRALALHQRGMALIAVLWLVAAMGLILSGVVRSVRSEAQTAGSQRQTAIASAKADAAILLALQNLHAQPNGLSKNTQTITTDFDGSTYQVWVAPLNGLIDINSASVALWAELYQHAAGLDPQAAQALAQATLEARQQKNAKSVEQGFASIQDLMRVPAMTYDLYAKVAPLVTADIKSGGGLVNPLAAPYEVLLVLTAGDAARATQFMSRRDADPNTLDTTFFNPALIDMATSNSLRLQVSIGLPDGASLQKSWHVFWGEDQRSGLPWRVLGMHQRIKPAVV